MYMCIARTFVTAVTVNVHVTVNIQCSVCNVYWNRETPSFSYRLLTQLSRCWIRRVRNYCEYTYFVIVLCNFSRRFSLLEFGNPVAFELSVVAMRFPTWFTPVRNRATLYSSSGFSSFLHTLIYTFRFRSTIASRTRCTKVASSAVQFVCQSALPDLRCLCEQSFSAFDCSQVCEVNRGLWLLFASGNDDVSDVNPGIFSIFPSGNAAIRHCTVRRSSRVVKLQQLTFCSNISDAKSPKTAVQSFSLSTLIYFWLSAGFLSLRHINDYVLDGIYSVLGQLSPLYSRAKWNSSFLSTVTWNVQVQALYRWMVTCAAHLRIRLHCVHLKSCRVWCCRRFANTGIRASNSAVSTKQEILMSFNS